MASGHHQKTCQDNCVMNFLMRSFLDTTFCFPDAVIILASSFKNSFDGIDIKCHQIFLLCGKVSILLQFDDIKMKIKNL